MNSTPSAAAPAETFQPGLFDGDEPSLDRSFATARRVRLDETAWIEHVPGWLAGSAQVLGTVLDTIAWEQRQRWMYTRMVTEPRLTAEYPVLANAPQPILGEIGAALSAHYGVGYERLWMNLYRDNNDGTGWHADRPVNKLPEATIPVLSLGAPRRFLIRPVAGGKSTVFTPGSGDLIVMGGTCQRGWEHCVPKQKTSAGPPRQPELQPPRRRLTSGITGRVRPRARRGRPASAKDQVSRLSIRSSAMSRLTSIGVTS